MNEPQQPLQKINDLLLDAVVTQIKYTYFDIREDGMPEIVSKELHAIAIPIDHIARAVDQEPSEDLQTSVLNEMKFPIIVTYNRKEEHAKAIKGLSNCRAYEDEKPFLNIIGNQRQVIGELFGFSHIHAFVVDTGKEALIVKKAYDDESAIR